MRVLLGILLVTGSLAACNLGNSAPFTTGLTGLVVRGPITPVCQVDVPCDAPFSAEFSVRVRDRTVGHFRSDADGRFTIYLAPGTYLIVPDPGAFFFEQSKTVEVGDSGLTTVTLDFDTGIR
jgi:hypothetical protein